MSWVHVDKRSDGVAILSLAKEPVNSMDLEFWKQIRDAFQSCESDPKTRGVIFASGLKKNVFTAGLDLKELHAPSTSRERLFEFWHILAKTLIAIYSSPMVTMAAISGACPAGGCCLALCCDYRVITQDGSMGLNEVAIGIPVPTYWVKLMVSIVGPRKADYILQTGTQVAGPSLIEMGMVDMMGKDRKEVASIVEIEMAKWLKNPDSGRIATKSELRGELTAAWTAGVEHEANKVWECISRKATSDFLGMVMAKLGGKRKQNSKL